MCLIFINFARDNNKFSVGHYCYKILKVQLEVFLNLDEQFFMFINQEFSSDWMDLFLVPIRHKLFWIPLYVFLIGYIILNFPEKRWWIFLGVTICMVLSDSTSSKLIKKSVQRERPCHVEYLHAEVRVPCSLGYSFTSSHATNHFALSTFLFMLFFTWRYRWLFFVWAGVIGYAQVYVGVHYPFDVIVGSVIGLLIGLLSFKIYSFLVHRFLS